MTLRIRLAVFILVAFFSVVLLALYAGNLESQQNKKLINIRTSSSELIRLAEQLDNQFQKQLLSWSNLLLRGMSPDEYHHYLQIFYQRERDTRNKTKTLIIKLGSYVEAQQKMESFGEAHNILGLRFRKALKIYNQSDNPVHDTDRYIWKAVDDPHRLLSEVKNSILDYQQKLLIKSDVEHDEKQTVIIYVGLLVVVGFIAIFIWMVDFNLGKPLSIVVNVAKKISNGDFSQRISKQLPGEFNLFAHAFNQMMNDLTQTQEKLQLKMHELELEIISRKGLEKELANKKNAAEDASRAKSEFLSTMSHEIRTPLNVVTGYAELLSMSEVTENQKKYVKSILSGSESLLSVINDILDFSKIESGKLSIEYKQFKLAELINEVNDMFSQSASEKGLLFEVSISQNVPEYIVMDAQRLKQILLNLLTNAIKFTDHGSIKLIVDASSTISSSRVNLCFKVEDSGIGIPEEYQDKIFNQFEQQDGQDSRKYGGSGLGLAISKKLAQLLNGDLTVSSSSGVGSVFSLDLHEVEASVKSSVNDNLTDKHFPRLDSSIILIADDIDANRNLIKSFLADQPVDFLEAVNGKQAIDIAQQNKPDLILMDIKMPEMDGVEATTIIKADEELKNIPVIALSASSMHEDDAQLKATLFDAYITKPINLSLLTKVLSQFLNS